MIYFILFVYTIKYNIVMKKFFYRVTEEDTVFSLSQKFSLSTLAIIKLNNLTCEISAGDLLYIETSDSVLYRVKPFETAESVGKKFNVSPEKILFDNGVPYLFYGLIISLPAE